MFATDRDVIAETKKLRVNINDFSVRSLIGKGYFGEVHLAIENGTKDVYAIKKMPKASFVHAKEERNIMAVSESEWIPALQYAFQVGSTATAAFLNRINFFGFPRRTKRICIW